MHISVTGHQIDISESLRRRVTERLIGDVEKFFENAIEGHIGFSRDGSMFRTHISVHVGKGIMMESHGTNGEIYASFSDAVEHLSKQLRRHKRRLRDHHKGSENPVHEDRG